MHNGLLIEEGCYYGPWMTEIIRGLRGHHEPQEEVVFAAILDRLARDRPVAPSIVEFGSFWSYYTMWFCAQWPTARGVAVEPDPVYLDIGRRNARLNSLSEQITFLPGAVGNAPGSIIEFVAESTGTGAPVELYDLDSLFMAQNLTRVDLAMIDIQGFETILLGRGKELLASGAIRFAIISTHHHRISGDYLTHQKALEVLLELGAHVIAEHSVSESFSGDGLIAVAFHCADIDLIVPISRARAKDSLFGEHEYELDRLAITLAERDENLSHYQRHVERIEAELDAFQTGSTKQPGQLVTPAPALPLTEDKPNSEVVDALTARLATATHTLEALHQSKLWRWSRLPRRVYSRLRR